MANSRTMFMGTAAVANGEGATFTPSQPVNLWEVRCIMADNVGGAGTVETVDADGIGVRVLEMAAADGDWLSNLDSKKSREFIVDSSCKSLKVGNTDATSMTVKVTAYRTVDDIPAGDFFAEGVVVA